MGSQGQHDADVPIVDIRPSNPRAPQQLLGAAANHGFVYIENVETGINHDDIQQMFQLSKEFFAAPLNIKEEVSISSNKAGKNHGWLGQGVEKLDPATQKRPDIKEALNIGEPIDGQFQQTLPKTLVPHTNTLRDFESKCHELCQRILQLFAISLGIPQDWFSSRHDRAKGVSGTIFRLLYYPKADAEDGVDIRAGAHSDYGSITLLFQQMGQPGLEIKTASGDWAPVAPINAILVNIGDLLQDWTGGLLVSTVHRVIFPQGGGDDRYSIAYFCHPLDDALLEPVPSDLVKRHAAIYGDQLARNGKSITAKDHLMERLATTYTVESK